MSLDRTQLTVTLSLAALGVLIAIPMIVRTAHVLIDYWTLRRRRLQFSLRSLLLFLVPAAAVATWVLKPEKPDDIFTIPDDVARIRFDAQQWHAAESKEETRLQMVEDLLATRKLEGQTRQQVIALLGSGDVQVASNVEAYSLRYLPVGEFGIGTLVIYFDAADPVQRHALKTFVYSY